MDASFSANYREIDFSFRTSRWEIYSAVHISSGVPVSLWAVNKMSDLFSRFSENEINGFLKKYRNSLTALQHIRHPNILRIYEISGEDQPLCFSSERIENILSNEVNFTEDESLYIMAQLTDALFYLHSQYKVAHFAVSPENIYFSPEFDLKLANLVHFSKFNDYNSQIEPNIYPINTSFFDVTPYFASPEVREHNNLTAMSDVYSFGLLSLKAFQTRKMSSVVNLNQSNDEISSDNFLNKFTTQNPDNIHFDPSDPLVPSDIKPIIQRCLLKDIDQRPTFEQIKSSSAVFPTNIRVLNFMSTLKENTLENRQNFYKNLATVFSDYSPRLLLKKFVPILVQEIHENDSFISQLLPLLLTTAEKINALDFEKFILRPLFQSEQCANYLIDQAIMMTNASVFIPILSSTIRSENISISSRSNELLKSFNALENIGSIVPLLNKIEDKSVLVSTLAACEGKIESKDSKLYIKQMKILAKRYQSNSVVLSAISSSLASLIPDETIARKAISLSLKIIDENPTQEAKQTLFLFIESCLNAVRDAHGLSSSFSSSNYGIVSVPGNYDDRKKHKKHRKNKHPFPSLEDSQALKTSNSQDTFPIDIDPFSITPTEAPKTPGAPFSKNVDPFASLSAPNSINRSKPLKQLSSAIDESGDPNHNPFCTPKNLDTPSDKGNVFENDPFRPSNQKSNKVFSPSELTNETPFLSIDPFSNNQPSCSRSARPPLPNEPLRHHHRSKSKNSTFDFTGDILQDKKRHKKGKNDPSNRQSIPFTPPQFDSSLKSNPKIHSDSSSELFSRMTSPSIAIKSKNTKYQIPTPPKKQRSLSKTNIELNFNDSDFKNI